MENEKKKEILKQQKELEQEATRANVLKHSKSKKIYRITKK